MMPTRFQPSFVEVSAIFLHKINSLPLNLPTIDFRVSNLPLSFRKGNFEGVHPLYPCVCFSVTRRKICVTFQVSMHNSKATMDRFKNVKVLMEAEFEKDTIYKARQIHVRIVSHVFSKYTELYTYIYMSISLYLLNYVYYNIGVQKTNRDSLKSIILWSLVYHQLCFPWEVCKAFIAYLCKQSRMASLPCRGKR